MVRFTEAARDCRVLTKAAVRDAGATEFRALGHADDGSLANADCRFPPRSAAGAAIARDTSVGQGAACAPTGADPRSVEAEAAAPARGATSANVARDEANDAEPPGVDPPFSPRAPGVPRESSIAIGS